MIDGGDPLASVHIGCKTPLSGENGMADYYFVVVCTLGSNLCFPAFLLTRIDVWYLPLSVDSNRRLGLYYCMCSCFPALLLTRIDVWYLPLSVGLESNCYLSLSSELLNLRR